jgi:hypothetical protein
MRSIYCRFTGNFETGKTNENIFLNKRFIYKKKVLKADIQLMTRVICYAPE